MVVTNSGPLIALAKLGLLGKLGLLYEKVAMPKAVYDEVVIKGFAKGCLDSLQVKLALHREYLFVMEVKNPNPKIKNLPLDKGEKEALNLALENEAAILLMDDMIAREHAKTFGFKVKGTLGVIVKAYREKLLSLNEVHIVFETIIKRNDIWIAKGLCQNILSRLKNETK
jgi:predicted nucleic acid-binding protein